MQWLRYRLNPGNCCRENVSEYTFCCRLLSGNTPPLDRIECKGGSWAQKGFPSSKAASYSAGPAFYFSTIYSSNQSASSFLLGLIQINEMSSSPQVRWSRWCRSFSRCSRDAFLDNPDRLVVSQFHIAPGSANAR